MSVCVIKMNRHSNLIERRKWATAFFSGLSLRSVKVFSIDTLQFVIYRVVSLLLGFGKSRSERIPLVIGTTEIANVLNSLGRAFPEGSTVCLNLSPYYSNSYTYQFREGPFGSIRRLFIGPVLLARYTMRTTNFFYLWQVGFMRNLENEFKLVRESGGRIAWMFCGDDIRSPKLQREIYSRLGRDSFVNYGHYLKPSELPESLENRKILLASLVEKYADAIFSAPMDQASYLSPNSAKFVASHGFIALSPRQFNESVAKFENLARIRIVHAPSSPEIKGTMLVRAAISALRNEGYQFDYIELTGVSNETVREELFNAHICLNQFLGLGSGVLGIEAMAARCVTLMSADPSLEPSIIPPCAESWIVTPSWEIANNLRGLLDDPKRLAPIAENGFSYAREHYSVAASSNRLRTELVKRGFSVFPSYRDPNPVDTPF